MVPYTDAVGWLYGGWRRSIRVELDNREDFDRVMKSLRTIPAVVNIQTGGAS